MMTQLVDSMTHLAMSLGMVANAMVLWQLCKRVSSLQVQVEFLHIMSEKLYLKDRDDS